MPSRKVIGAACKVSSTLGIGFLEKVYENALAVELRKQGIAVEQQRGVLVRYEGEIVGEYVPDLIVEDAIIVEVKAHRLPGTRPSPAMHQLPSRHRPSPRPRS